MTNEKKKTVSPYANGPGALEARRKALKPSFKDLEARAEAMRQEQDAELEAAAYQDKEDLPEGVNMGMSGELPPHIPESVKEKLVKKADVRKPDFDPLAPFVDNTTTVHPGELAHYHGPAHIPPAPVTVTATPCEHEAFFEQEQAVTLRMDNGQFTINAIDVRETEFSIAIMVSLDDRFIFIPVPGAEMTLTYKVGKEAKVRKVYFPGTHVNYEELGIMLLLFVVANKED